MPRHVPPNNLGLKFSATVLGGSVVLFYRIFIFCGTIQVVYRGENASLPIIVQNALMRLPATIEYDILDLYGNIPTYLEEDQQSGVLEWDAELGNVLLLDLDIDWSNVSLHLEAGSSY